MKVSNKVILFCCLSLCSAILAADGDAAAPAAGEQTKSGTLVAKPATAGADVLAVLHSGGADYNLAATGAMAVKLDELLKKGATVQVTGAVNGDKMTISQIAEAEAAKPDETKKDKKNKGEKKKKKKDQ